MDTNKLYPELADYIFDYCQRFMTKNELQAHKHSMAISKIKGYVSKKWGEFWKRGGYITEDKNVLICWMMDLKLLNKAWFEGFIQNIN